MLELSKSQKLVTTSLQSGSHSNCPQNIFFFPTGTKRPQWKELNLISTLLQSQRHIMEKTCLIFHNTFFHISNLMCIKQKQYIGFFFLFQGADTLNLCSGAEKMDQSIETIHRNVPWACGADRNGTQRENFVTVKCSRGYHNVHTSWHARSKIVEKKKKPHTGLGCIFSSVQVQICTCVGWTNRSYVHSVTAPAASLMSASHTVNFWIISYYDRF